MTDKDHPWGTVTVWDIADETVWDIADETELEWEDIPGRLAQLPSLTVKVRLIAIDPFQSTLQRRADAMTKREFWGALFWLLLCVCVAYLLIVWWL